MSKDIVERLRDWPSMTPVACKEAADEIERLRNNILSLQDENEQLKVSLVRICGMAHDDRRVLEVRPRDDVMPGAFIAKLKRPR